MSSAKSEAIFHIPTNQMIQLGNKVIVKIEFETLVMTNLESQASILRGKKGSDPSTRGQQRQEQLRQLQRKRRHRGRKGNRR